VVVGFEYRMAATEHPDWSYPSFTSRSSFELGILTEASVVPSDLTKQDSNNLRLVGGDRRIYRLILASKSQEIVQNVTSSSRTYPPRTMRVAEVTLDFPDEALAKRVSEAFLHAASLCRNKKQPF
jgi:hypothetical protein